MSRRPFLVLVSALLLLLSSLSAASAAAPSTAEAGYYASQYYAYTSNTRCNTYNQRAYAYMDERGNSGTNWFRITAYFQYKYSGQWYTQTRRDYTSVRFSGGSHSFDWDPKFNYSGNTVTYPTRIHFSFKWYSRYDGLLFRRIANSRTCY